VRTPKALLKEELSAAVPLPTSESRSADILLRLRPLEA
jgi:hypothetical protein